MKQLKFLLVGVIAFIAAMPVFTAVSQVQQMVLPDNAPVFYTGLVLGVAALQMVKPAAIMPGVHSNDIIKEIWAKYIITRLFKDNQFLNFVFDDSVNVKDGRIVHLPQISGTKPEIVKNRSSLPATAVRRGDTDVLYALDEYTSTPDVIPNIDQVHISYSKQDAVLGDHMGVISDTVADDLILKWAANATSIRTTGAAVSPIAGQTGNRKGFTHKDLKTAMTKFNVANVSKQDRYVMIDDNMYDYFYDSLSETNAKDFSRYADAENGVVGKLHSFNIMTRSSVGASAANDTVKALGAALAATDNLFSLAWQKNSLAAAIGERMLFQDKGNPLYYGDIYSLLVMAGGRVRRGDGHGVLRITQDASA